MKRPLTTVLAALVLCLACLAATPCAAGEWEEMGSGEAINNRSELDVDDIKPGDDDQPTIGARRRPQSGTQSGIPSGGGSGAQATREPSQPETAPPGTLRTWIDTVRALFERAGTLR